VYKLTSLEPTLRTDVSNIIVSLSLPTAAIKEFDGVNRLVKRVLQGLLRTMPKRGRKVDQDWVLVEADEEGATSPTQRQRVEHGSSVSKQSTAFATVCFLCLLMM